jgi:hypothetical protein
MGSPDPDSSPEDVMTRLSLFSTPTRLRADTASDTEAGR